MEEIFSSKRSISREVDIDVHMIPPGDSLEEILSLESNNEEEEQTYEEEMDQTNAEVINLPNLKSVALEFLPQLNSVCKGTMLYGSLQEFHIYYCPKLKLVPRTQTPFVIK